MRPVHELIKNGSVQATSIYPCNHKISKHKLWSPNWDFLTKVHFFLSVKKVEIQFFAKICRLKFSMNFPHVKIENVKVMYEEWILKSEDLKINSGSGS